MNIKVLDSWLKEYLTTRVETKRLADMLSLSSVSVERIEDFKEGKVMDIEVTTNRPDLMSINGLARESNAVLPEFDVEAKYTPPALSDIPKPEGDTVEFTVKNDPMLVNRLCAVVMEVEVDDSPELIKDRLESTGIRSLNNVIDITNYLMREMGHPTHVFDYDRLGGTHLVVTTSQKDSTITTLDKKTYTLEGGDIVAVNPQGEIVDLLGVMGLENSVVTKRTKRIVLFINNNNPDLIRRTSLTYGIRTEAAILNEKNLDPELAMDTLKRGVELYQKYANGKVISPVLDIYPNRAKEHKISVSYKKIYGLIGIEISRTNIQSMLTRLGFRPESEDTKLTVTVPTWREEDITIPEDVIEEIARIYGYHNIPARLPDIFLPTQNIHNNFYWESATKSALKHWGFTEIYTYSMIGENSLEVAPEDALTLSNPLTDDHMYMRTKLVPSLLEAIKSNPQRDEILLFELSNVYLRKSAQSLPDERLTLGIVIKKPQVTFFEGKGLITALGRELGIKNIKFSKRKTGGIGADIQIDGIKVGEIEILEKNLLDIEIDFEAFTKSATTMKKYTPLAKYPPVIEDVTLALPDEVEYTQVIEIIIDASTLVKRVELIDTFENKRTFRITYQDKSRNLSGKDIEEERKVVYEKLKNSLHAEIDE